jgi:hypothetical protein
LAHDTSPSAPRAKSPAPSRCMCLIDSKASQETSISLQLNPVTPVLLYQALPSPLNSSQMISLHPSTSVALTSCPPSHYLRRIDNACPPKPQFVRLPINKNFSVINYHTGDTHDFMSWGTSHHLLLIREVILLVTPQYIPLSPSILMDLPMWPHYTLNINPNASTSDNLRLILLIHPRSSPHTSRNLTPTHLHDLDHMKCIQRNKNNTWHPIMLADLLTMANSVTILKNSTPHTIIHRTQTPPQFLLKIPSP